MDYQMETESEKITVQTADGPIIGFVDKQTDNHYYHFKGIQYAKPPLGNLRFMPPVPVQPWTEPKNCTTEPPQSLYICKEENICGNEDCLYINVQTKTLKPDKPLPVMFSIQGFCYIFSLNDILDPKPLVDEDVVLVKCGHRVGPFGFLSINNIIAPGNAGLKDVVCALKWVQRNISAFGGDPNNVTIFGNSSGGAITHFMIFSSMAAGLFHKVIISSASALNNWALCKNPTQPLIALAQELGIDTNQDKMEIVEILKTLPAEDIMKAMTSICRNKSETNVFDAVFKPCIEDEFEGQQAFLTKSPVILLKSGKYNKVPMIIGNNQSEAAAFEFIIDKFYENYERYKKDTCLLVPRALAGESNMSKNIGNQIQQFYFGDDDSQLRNINKFYLQIISDYYFVYYINKSVRQHSRFSNDQCPLFYYVLNYAGDWNVVKNLEFLNSVGHGGELPYIFEIKPPNSPAAKGGKDTELVRKRVVKMWTNFAKYGNPTPIEDPLLQIKWDPVESPEKLNYLQIGSELTKGRNPFHDRMQFWDKLHSEHTFLRALVHFNDIGMNW